ncbi:MauE/DoxX family redox-associated membrane protein [Novosphingobium mangrovi (ex Huang et al. 2023)]|uniref:Methylamine utilization protein MauE n=1 Tax=Novosphingobium mangrovi (ex Huang et al. 2023) TaxID=2976432 RepID=A0ABT2I840_9SPHN|nr:MauE/DoxX family redox-associated membrane protein [Novosphingobium mangrovi (ex Huang et al. 2023)]MCT2400753.1 glutaredoxin [Novosphingobium mangrovi (ex Huang et al. 2023)]
MDPNKHAVLYRMVMAKHVCPFGLKSKHLLERRGYRIEDNWLASREEAEAFKAAHDVATTPQAFIAGQRIGGYTDLRRFFGIETAGDSEGGYIPVLCVFGSAAAIALAASWSVFGTIWTVSAAEWFVSITMLLLAMSKMQDIEQFSTRFLSYDLLARRWVPYAHVYPFLEWMAGALMIAHVLPWLSAPIALFIGIVGAVSVLHAVYVQKCALECACVGGAGRLPLGFVSLTENLFVIGMGLWTLAGALSSTL